MAINREAILKKTKAEIVDALVQEVADVDDRRQRQIRNQVASINRIMAGASYDDEMAKLQEELADTQARLEAALMEIRQLKGHRTSAYNLGGR
jgi:hypothetical protein